jgi:hypothetical protein
MTVTDSDPAAPPTIAGTVAGQTTSDNASIDPFSHVTISDPNAGSPTDTLTITLSGGGGTLAGTGLSGSNGTYTLTGSAATVTSELDGLVFTPTGTPNGLSTTTFTLSDVSSVFGRTTYTGSPIALASFNGADGETPYGGLIADAAGDLFGTTSGGGVNDGTVFELVNSSSGYSAPVTLASFNGADGDGPFGSLISDAAGDLFGTTYSGGADSDGTVFELVNSSSGYSAPVTLASFNGADGETLTGALVSDAAGDLFGTTEYGGADNDGVVYELVKTSSGYSAPVTLASFNGSNGQGPFAGLISDAEGDLFGTAEFGGNGYGVVFELVNSSSGYSAPVVLAAFNGANGQSPVGSLLSDAAGDLFGTTADGGAYSDGVVFELVKTSSGYSAPVTLASFNGVDGALPEAGLITDAEGDLFGTTSGGGADGDGTAFELINTSSGFSAPITLASLNGADGNEPFGGLVADAAGDLIGTATYGGANNDGAVFEISGAFALAPTVDATTTVIDNDQPPGFVAPTVTGTVANQTTYNNAPIDPFSSVTIADANANSPTDTLTITLSGAGGTLAGTDLSGSNGTYTLSGSAATVMSELDALVFTPSAGAPNSATTTTFTLSDASSADSLTPTVNSSTTVTNSVAGAGAAPTIAATVAGQTTAGNAPIDPFSHVTIGDANPGSPTETLTITSSGGAGTLSGAGLSGSNGAYSLTGSAATVTSEVDALVFTPTGTPGGVSTTRFTLSDASSAYGVTSFASTPTVLASFNGADGVSPDGGNLIADAAGNLFGMAFGPGGAGTSEVYELVKTGSSYSAPIVLASFNSSYGLLLNNGLIADAEGDLFGTTDLGGAYGDGSVFEIVNSASGYSAPVTIASFNGSQNGNLAGPDASLISDPAGDLFGTGGAFESATETGLGSVFEIVNSSSGYSGPVELAGFNGTTDGTFPDASLLADAAGDLFGTTVYGSTAYPDGTVFEIVKSGSTYSGPVTIAGFNGADGANPESNLISDAEGDLFGTTGTGGAYGDGVVFELVNSSSGYSAPVDLASFNGADGSFPVDGMIADANGDLFGTTAAGGNGYGTVFELVKTSSGYSAPVTLIAFNNANGNEPLAGLISDAAGDLFGTTDEGGANDDGEVFEIAASLSPVPTVDSTTTVIDNDLVGPALGFNAPVSFSGPTMATLSGTVVEDGGVIAGVALYEGPVDAEDLIGDATVSGSTWSLSASLTAGSYGDIQAVATDQNGNATTVAAPYTLLTGITGAPFTAEEVDYDDGQAIDQTFFNSDGSVYLVDQLSPDPNGGLDEMFTGGSFFADEPYRSFLYKYDSAGDPLTESYFNSDGTTYLFSTAQSLGDGVTAFTFSSGSAFASLPYSSYEYDYDSANVLIGSKFFYTDITGQPYTAAEYDYDGAGDVTAARFSGVSGQAYSAYVNDYVGGVYAGSQYTFTIVPMGATYSSYETDYNSQGAYTGDRFFFTNLPGQNYTGEEEDFDANSALTRVLITGVTGQSYSSLEEDYSAGTYEGYKAYYAITGQSYTTEEVDVSAANQITKIVYSGMSSTPYSSVEEDYSNGVVSSEIYDFTNVTGARYYAYQVDENASGVAQQEILDNNDGSHTMIGLGAAGQTFTSIGDDTFTGGGASETFVFQPIYGSDTITDFYQYTSGATADTISLSTSEFANFAAVLSGAQNVGANVVITAPTGDTLTLSNLTTTTLAGLSADFTFHT